jgi:hypothetical protein
MEVLIYSSATIGLVRMERLLIGNEVRHSLKLIFKLKEPMPQPLKVEAFQM